LIAQIIKTQGTLLKEMLEHTKRAYGDLDTTLLYL